MPRIGLALKRASERVFRFGWMTKPDPLARFTLLVLLPNRGLRWVQSPRVTSQQLESTVRLLFQIFGPTDEYGIPHPKAHPAGLDGIVHP